MNKRTNVFFLLLAIEKTKIQQKLAAAGQEIPLDGFV